MVPRITVCEVGIHPEWNPTFTHIHNLAWTVCLAACFGRWKDTRELSKNTYRLMGSDAASQLQDPRLFLYSISDPFPPIIYIPCQFFPMEIGPLMESNTRFYIIEYNRLIGANTGATSSRLRSKQTKIWTTNIHPIRIRHVYLLSVMLFASSISFRHFYHVYHVLLASIAKPSKTDSVFITTKNKMTTGILCTSIFIARFS